MKPLAWSHSALQDYDKCPEMYHHKKVLKDLPQEVKSEEQKWGETVHKQFEWHGSRPGFELPPDLRIHSPFLEALNAEGADADVDQAEMKVALSTKFKPCKYFTDPKKGEPSVWWRGVIDRQIIKKAEARAKIVDYKTGKKKDDWVQLAQSAIWMFVNYPEVNLINAQFYWTVDQTMTRKVWARSEMDTLAGMYAPQLEAYVHSFKTDTWPMKQSGLCKGWCPVKSCQFWEERKYR